MTALALQQYLDFAYIIAVVLFILSLRFLSSPASARWGVLAGEIGAALAVGATLFNPELVQYKWIVITLIIGAGVGIPLGLVQMTAVPQRTALSHAFGALSAAIIGIAEFYVGTAPVTRFQMGEIALEVIIGSLTFTGSVIAAGKLQELLPQRPIVYRGQNIVSLSVLAAALALAVALVVNPAHAVLFPIMVIVALIFGVLLVTPIGGADMPTVISLLNSYAGFSAALLGFVLNSKVLVVAGALDGSSGFILSVIMCKAMNRSFANVMFGAFGQVQVSAAGVKEERVVRSANPEEAAAILSAASSVVIVPGYGMAVAQAQHKVRELYDMLTKKGIDVRFAIHPCRRTHARPHERAARRGRHSLRPPHRDGGNQRRLPADRRRPHYRRQRRDESGSSHRSIKPDFRNANSRCRQSPYRHGHQAQHESRLRRHRQPALLSASDAHAVR